MDRLSKPIRSTTERTASEGKGQLYPYWKALLAAIWIALTVYAFTIVLTSAQRKSHGFSAYYTAAYILVHDPSDFHRIYEDEWFASQIEVAGIPDVHDIFNVQPPTMSLVMLPLVVFQPTVARAVWIVLSAVWLVLGLMVLANALRLPYRLAWITFPACFLYRPVVENFRYGQMYAALFLLLCLVVWRTIPRREIGSNAERIAGISLGIAAISKTAGAWLWPNFLLAGRWRSVVWGALSALVVGLVSLPWIGIETWKSYLTHLPELARDPRRYVTAYQTVTSLIGHLTVFDTAWNPRPAIHAARLAAPLILFALVASLIVSVWIGRRTEGRVYSESLVIAIYIALVVANAPLGEGYHYVLFLPALLIALVYAYRNRVSRKEWILLAAVVFLTGAPLPYMSDRLKAGWLALFAYPRVYGAYLLWVWCCFRCYRDAEQKEDTISFFRSALHHAE